MLEVMASPGSILWTTWALLSGGALVLALRSLMGWGRTASTVGLLCGVLAVLCSSHYLLFVWASDAFLALPGLVLGLPLIYVGSLGVLTSPERRPPFGAAILLAGGLALLLLNDAQQLWSATFHRLKGTLMGYPDLVLYTGEDLGQHIPAPGTRVIFEPAKSALSCGLLADPEAESPGLAFQVDCQDYYWGQAMLAVHEMFRDLPRLDGLADLWDEYEPGKYSTLQATPLTPLAIANLQQLCPQHEDCLSSKQAILGVLGQRDWSEFQHWLDIEGGQLPQIYRALSPGERDTLIMVLAQDIRGQLEKRVADIVSVYTDAQAKGLILRDLAPRYSSPSSESVSHRRLTGTSAKTWNSFIKTLHNLPVELPNTGSLRKLRNAILVAVDRQEGGGARLVYHTDVGRQAVASLVLFVIPPFWLALVLLVLIWRCFVRR